MSDAFFDSEKLRERAKRNHEAKMSAVAKWWMKKYNRPANDPLLLNRSEASIMLEWYEDLYQKKSDLEMQLDSGEGDRQSTVDELNQIEKALGEKKSLSDGIMTTGDPLVDYWEREIAAGREPDFNKTEVP